MNNIPNYRKTSLTDVFSGFNEIIKEYLTNNLFTIDFCKIKSLNENSVNVVPIINKRTTTGQIIEITDNDIISNVPVLFFQGGDCSISFKLNIGDYGLLITTKSNSYNFIKTLNNSIAGSYKYFDLSSSLFIPMQIMNINSNILIKNTNTTIEVTPTQVNIDGIVNITGDTTIEGNTDITGNTNITGETTITGNETVNGNQTTTGIITAGQILPQNGVTGVFIDVPSNVKLIFTNGILTKIE